MLLVRSRDHEGAARAVNNARADIIREIDPNYVTNAMPAGNGVFFWIDGRAVDDYEVLPTILADHLAREGVDDAVIAVPREGGPLTDPNRGLMAVRRAVVLSLYPPPPERFYDDPPARIPDSWLDEAVAWVRGDLADDDLAMVALEGCMEFPLPIGAGMAFFERARASRPVVSLLVAGDLSSRLRGANGCFHSPIPRLVLAGGGPADDDAELVATFESLAGVARRLAPDLGCAFIQADPKFDSFFRGSPGDAWQGEGGEVDYFLKQVCDEFVFDAYPYQVLGPRHLARLDTTPPGARPLPGGRVELAIGEPSAWLVDQTAPEPTLTRSFAVPRMDPGIQAAGREILAPCLLRKGEALAFSRARLRAAAAVDAAVIPAPDHPDGRE